MLSMSHPMQGKGLMEQSQRIFVAGMEAFGCGPIGYNDASCTCLQISASAQVLASVPVVFPTQITLLLNQGQAVYLPMFKERIVNSHGYAGFPSHLARDVIY